MEVIAEDHSVHAIAYERHADKRTGRCEERLLKYCIACVNENEMVWGASSISIIIIKL